MVLGRVAGRFGSVWVGFWVGLGRFQTQFFFFRQLLFGPKKKNFFFFFRPEIGSWGTEKCKKRQNFDVLTIWGYTICTATGAHNLDFSLANSFTKIFFFDFGKGKSQAKKIHP